MDVIIHFYNGKEFCSTRYHYVYEISYIQIAPLRMDIIAEEGHYIVLWFAQVPTHVTYMGGILKIYGDADVADIAEHEQHMKELCKYLSEETKKRSTNNEGKTR